MGRLNYVLENYEKALKYFKIVSYINPLDENLFLLKANAQIEIRDYKSALKNFNRSITIYPTSNKYLDRGILLIKMKYYKKAKEDFKQVIMLDTKNNSAFFFFGVSQLLSEEFVPAKSIFSVLVQRDPLDYEAHLGLAITYLKSNDLKKVTHHFHKVKLILKIVKRKNIESLKDTYWYQDQYLYLKQHLKKLIAL